MTLTGVWDVLFWDDLPNENVFGSSIAPAHTLEEHFKEQICRAKEQRSAATKREREERRKENLKVDQVRCFRSW
jgi:hypothetical protein